MVSCRFMLFDSVHGCLMLMCALHFHKHLGDTFSLEPFFLGNCWTSEMPGKNSWEVIWSTIWENGPRGCHDGGCWSVFMFSSLQIVLCPFTTLSSSVHGNACSFWWSALARELPLILDDSRYHTCVICAWFRSMSMKHRVYLSRFAQKRCPPIIHALWEEVWPDARTTERAMWGPEILRFDWWLLCNLVLVFVVQGREAYFSKLVSQHVLKMLPSVWNLLKPLRSRLRRHF